MLTFTSHPSPNGEDETKVGSSTAAWLTSTTSPENGAIMSEAIFEDSTIPKVEPCSSVSPTFGSSIYTTSVKWETASAVIPTVPTLPSTLVHSWDLAYLRSVGPKKQMC